MATGQKDEKRFLLERGDKNLSAAPQKNQAEREDLRAKTRSGEREGKRKKDKNQNLQTDKCIFKFLFNLTSVFSVRLPSWSNTTLSFDVLIGQRGQSGFFFWCIVLVGRRQRREEKDECVCLSVAELQTGRKTMLWSLSCSAVGALGQKNLSSSSSSSSLRRGGEWMEGGNVSDRRGGRVSATGGDSRARRQEGTRRPGGEETRAEGQEREETRKIGEWTRRWRKGKGRGDEEGNKIRTGKVSKRKGVEPRKWGQEKKFKEIRNEQGKKERRGNKETGEGNWKRDEESRKGKEIFV